jgi:hypothetical protein
VRQAWHVRQRWTASVSVPGGQKRSPAYSENVDKDLDRNATDGSKNTLTVIMVRMNFRAGGPRPVDRHFLGPLLSRDPHRNRIKP